MKKRMLSLFLSLMMTMALVLPVFATDEETYLTKDTIERVKQEVLDGEITNQEDVLKVVLAQYENRLRNMSNENGVSSFAEENGTPSITEIVETYVDENGHLTQLIANTGLLVVDKKNGEAVSLDRLYNTATNSLSEYAIRATLSVYYYAQYSLDDITTVENKAKIYKMITTLYYDGSYKATHMEQYYNTLHGEVVPVWFLQGSYDNPKQGSYACYPPQAEWVKVYGHPYPGFGCIAYVDCEGKRMEVAIDINSSTIPDYDGKWDY